jgi:HD-like signal output (HDOD) protein
MKLESLLDRPNKLPTIPKVTQQLMRSFGDENVTIDEIARHLSADPTMSAKLLRLANSAYFNLSRTIGTVDDALRMLGFTMVRNLVLGQGLAAAFRGTPGLQMAQFWRYNLYAACGSRWLAQRAGADADTTFTVGLLHGIGQLHLHAGAPREVAALDRTAHVLAARAQAEQEAFGFHHGDVAAELARIWNFPPPIVAALRAVPAPLAAPPFSPPAGCVHLAAWRARVEVLAGADAGEAGEYPVAVGRRLALDPAWAEPAAQGTAGVEPMPPLERLTEGLEAMLE